MQHEMINLSNEPAVEQIQNDENVGDKENCMATKVDDTRQRIWVDIVEGKEEVWRDNMGSSAVSISKLHYVPPMEKDGKPIVHLKSGNFVNVKKKFENLVIGGFVWRRPPFIC